MAPIYTARHVSSSDKTTPLFALKGLKNLSPTTVSESNIHGIPLERQVAYTEYSNNIASFVAASVSNKRVVVSNRPFGYLKSNHQLPLIPPPVHFTLQKDLTFEIAEKFVRKLGPGASKNKIGKTTIYQTPSLPIESLSTVISLSTTHFNSGRNALNPMGIKAFLFLSSAFAEVLRIHSYSAFHIESDETRLELSMLMGDKLSAEYFIYKPKTASRIEQSSYLREKHAIELADKDAMTEASVISDAVADKLRTLNGYIVSTGIDSVLTANPPRTHTVNVGPSTAVPNESGILFPYFTGLVQPDSQMLSSFTIRHLFQLLGSTIQECQNTYADLRRGFNSLATTDVGMELSHIGFGIDIAIRTQGRCFVIIESNRYLGFTILGARFAIFDSTKWMAPVEAAELRRDLSAIDPHQAAVSNLVEMFRGMLETQLYKGPVVTPEMFSDPKNLVEVFAGVQLDKLGEVEKEIDRNLRCLSYMGDGFLQRNPQVVAEVLESLFSDSVIELGRPTYLASVRSNISSREYILLSRFGPEAPSLWNERGTEFECVAKESPVVVGSKRKMGDPDTYANLPERLLVTPKPLDIAVKDMGRVIERGAVRMDLKERAGKNRNMSVESELMRKRIWKALVDGLQSSQAKKRKVDSEKKNAVASGDFDALLLSMLE